MEEFERINPIPAGVIRCGSGYAATDWGWVSRDYVKAFKAFSEGWQASRAALCVQMPRCCNEEQDSYRLNIIDSLDDAGVRYE